MAAGPGQPTKDALIGRDVGDFRLEARIGAGATGVVYRAIHTPTGGPAAVKVLNDHLGRISSLERRFRREARVLGRLDHPNIVHIFEFGVTDDATFIAMELLEGETLDQRIHRAAIPSEVLLGYARAIVAALAHAHSHEIVHRDLKPANVFLVSGEHPTVKLLDFGLAKVLAIDELSGDVTLTRKGRVVGTPAYMAPEQITGVSLDPRADIYAFGVLLFEMIADRRPFEYAKRSELLRAHLFEPAPELEAVRPDLRIHRSLGELLARALNKDPDARFANAGELLVALSAVPDDAIQSGSSSRARSERPRGETSSVVMSDDELRAARTPPARPVKAVPRPKRRTEPGDTKSPRAGASAAVRGHAHDSRNPSDAERDTGTSTDEHGKFPMWLLGMAATVALTTGLLSYWIGSQFR
jgi:serine/threonine protein kinase